ncbi:MAG: hypothetical protein HOC23_06140 [Halieaceae bacterium]|jgi:hypothetical protein|nr:hypothetical protein [Halieaceae bacterium]
MNRLLPVLGAIALLTGCVTSSIDERVFNEPIAGIGESSVVILGRRHASNYETEPDFVRCVGKYISSHDKSLTVVGELEFINALYPWFEPRTAPLRPLDIDKLLGHEAVAQKLRDLKTQYMIWIDGRTERSESAGSMSCGIGPGGAGCFGFGTWRDDSNYEATIWDFSERAEVGRIQTHTSGQSYMPAVIIPIPIIAPVQGTACDGIGSQLLKYLSSNY